MSEYGSSRRYGVGSPYGRNRRNRYRTPLNLYDKMRSRYNLPKQGSGRRDRPYTRPSHYGSRGIRYQSEKYRAKPEAGKSSPTIIRKVNTPYRVEFPPYKSEPDTEQLLKELENRFDEKLQQQVAERLEQDFQRLWAETLREHGLTEYADDESRVRGKMHESQEQQLDFLEAKNSTDKRSDETAENGVLNNAEFRQEYAETASEYQSENVENAHHMSADGELEETEDVADKEPVDPHGEPLDRMAEAPPEEVAREWADDSLESMNVSREELEKDMLLSDKAEALSDMLAEPDLLADIEALYDELDAEQLETDEEPLEPAY